MTRIISTRRVRSGKPFVIRTVAEWLTEESR